MSRNVFGAQALWDWSREVCIEVYIDNQRIFVIVYKFITEDLKVNHTNLTTICNDNWNGKYTQK